MIPRFLLLSCLSICLHMQIAACEPESVKKGFTLIAENCPYIISVDAARQSITLKNKLAANECQLKVPMHADIMPLTVFCMEQFYKYRHLQSKTLLDQVYENAATFLKPFLKQNRNQRLKDWLKEPIGSRDSRSSQFKKLQKKWPFEVNFLLAAAADYLKHHNLYNLATRQTAYALKASEECSWYESENNLCHNTALLLGRISKSFAFNDIDRWRYLLGKSSEKNDHSYSIAELQEYGKLPRQMQYDNDLNCVCLANLVGLDSFIPQNTTYLLLRNNHLTKISASDPLPESLKSLNLCANPLQEINLKRLTNLQELCFDAGSLRDLNLPDQLRTLSITDNNVNDLTALSALRTLELCQNKISQLTHLPPSLCTLLIANNKVAANFDLGTLTNLIEFNAKCDDSGNCKPFTVINYPPQLLILSVTNCALKFG